MTTTIAQEKASPSQQSALRQRANALHLDLDAASMAYAHALPDMLSGRAASQLYDYLASPDCRDRFTIKPQPRCPIHRLPVGMCKCRREGE